MTSAFSFAFGGDDIEVDDDLSDGAVSEELQETAAKSKLLDARRHHLKELVSHSDAVPEFSVFRFFDAISCHHHSLFSLTPVSKRSVVCKQHISILRSPTLLRITLPNDYLSSRHSRHLSPTTI